MTEHPTAGASPPGAHAQDVLRVDRVRRSFSGAIALDDVSLTVAPGEMVGLLGPNGAGKTTLLSLVTGLRRPDSGTVQVFGGNPRDPASRVRLGTTPQETGLPASLTVGEVVDLVGGHYPDPMPRGELLSRFGLVGLERRQTGGLSGGQKRRLAVALSLVGRPGLVLLDEPTTGLDVEGRRALWDAVHEYHAEGSTVLVTSHYLEEIEALAERVVVLGSGRVLTDAPLTQVLSQVAVRRVAFDTAVDDDVLAALPGVTSVERDGERRTLLTADSDALVRALVTAEIGFGRLEVRGATLEEAFLSLTGRDAAKEAA